MEFDYVIVGAGTAGCALAGRLAAKGARILLLEAGGDDSSLWVHIPVAWPVMLRAGSHHWRYADDRGPEGQALLCTGGKVVGGSSSVNALGYVRGHRSDFDRWGRSGLPHLSYNNVLPYFRRMETWEDGESAYRGGNGPIHVTRSKYFDSVTAPLLQAAEGAGLHSNDDYNGADQDGLSWIQSTIYKGRRCSAADAYLHDACTGGRITLKLRSFVQRINIRRGQATGVSFAKGDKTFIANALREVIVAAGAFQSPQLLMLSGIGDPDKLSTLGIKVESALPSVGRNLRNHVSVALRFPRKKSGTFHARMRTDRAARELFKARFLGTGVLTRPPNCLVGFVRTRAGLDAPDVQIIMSPTSELAEPYIPFFQQPYRDEVTFRAVLLRPSSVGSINLVSASPLAPIRISQNILTTEVDRETLVRGLALVSTIARQNCLVPEIYPSGQLDDKKPDYEALAGHVLSTATSLYHQSGTCRMGPSSDEGAVVSPDFRVRGVENLRVVDASVMPDLVGGNINACVGMLAELASDVILGKAAG